MTDFAPILAAAEVNAGGAEALSERLPTPKSPAELGAVADGEYFSLMSRRIFRAGIKHSVVDNRWPAFEEVFHGFDPRRVRAMSDEDLEALMADERIIRHWGKIKATRDNAAAMCALAAEEGGMGAYVGDWPVADTAGLWADLAKRFSHMGGNSAPYFLRMSGRDTFMLTGDVARGLNQWGAYDSEPKGKRAHAEVQRIFNGWVDETGLPLCQLSLILAISMG